MQDANSNRASVRHPNGVTTTYTYDALNRLTREFITEPLGAATQVDYGYDAVGNRLSKTVDGLLTVNYAYDANDRLLSEGSTTYSYDANGNTLSKNDGSLTSYAYDAENRLIRAQTATDIIDYTYDANGIRQSQTVNGNTISYLVDQNRDYAQVLEERDATGALIVAYTYGDDLLSQHRGGTTRYYHYDGLGSTRALTDATEAITDTYTYDAFGNLIRSTGTTPNNYLYTGEQYDPNIGFYYLRARYMNPENGRFLTIDPFAGYLQFPITLNKYLYAGVNPVNYTDPSGYIFGGFALGGFPSLAISSVLRTSVGTLSSVAGRSFITRMLFGNPPKSFGIVGEFIIENAVLAVVGELMNTHYSKSTFGTKAHKRLERRIKGYKPHPDVDIEVEVFSDKKGNRTGRRSRGSLGVDILVKYKGRPVVAFDLKTGRGFGKRGLASRIRRFGVDIVEIRVIPQ